MSLRTAVRAAWVLLLPLGCAHVETTVVPAGGGSAPATRAEDIRIYRNAKPAGAYEVLGKIESHIQRNIFFGGSARLEDEGYAELRQKASRMGGNGVIIEDVVETKAAELTHVHIWATVVSTK